MHSTVHEPKAKILPASFSGKTLPFVSLMQLSSRGRTRKPKQISPARGTVTPTLALNHIYIGVWFNVENAAGQGDPVLKMKLTKVIPCWKCSWPRWFRVENAADWVGSNNLNKSLHCGTLPNDNESAVTACVVSLRSIIDRREKKFGYNLRLWRHWQVIPEGR